MTPTEALELGRAVGRRVCPRGPWCDDVAAAAAFAAWQHPECPASAAWCAAVDELRKLTHYDRRSGSAPEVVAIAVEIGVDDAYDLGGIIDSLDGRDRIIAGMLADGWPKGRIADVLGVSASRVGQLVARIRRQLT